MGKFNLYHRVVLPPLTRNRAFNNTPQAHGVEYYSQRATNGGLIISEAAAATDISIRCPNMPGIWTEKQVEAWKPIVEEVHAKGGIIFCQIWHPARISNYTFAPEGSDLIKPISNKKLGGDYHSFDVTSRRSHTPGEEGEGQANILLDRADVAVPDEPHAYLLFGQGDQEDGSSQTEPQKWFFADRTDHHANILQDKEDGSSQTDEPHAYIFGWATMEDRESFLIADSEEAAASSLGSTSEDGNVAQHVYILFDREEGSASEDGNVGPHAYILSASEDGSVATHAYVILDRDDGVALPVSSANGESGNAHPYILLDRKEAHTVPLLIADRVYPTTTDDRELDLDDKGVVSDKLSIEKSQSIINDFALAARNAIKAGFDGVEINCAHGYLIERHLNEHVTNNTPDPYGGSIEKRCRLALDVVQAVSNEIGSDRVGIKLSPFDDFHGSGNLSPITVGTYLATRLNNLGLLYLHVTEPRMIKTGDGFKTPRSLHAIRDAFDGTLIASGGYDKADGDVAVAEDYADLVSFGRLFVANPDLVKRFELNAALNKHDRSTFYVPEPVLGYTDYPSLEIVS